MPKIYTLFDNPPKVGLACPEDSSMAQQHFKDEADINNIMRNYNKTGYLTDPLKPATAKPMFSDFSTDFDYQEAQNMLVQAQNMFMELPSNVRRRFENDPALLLEFIADPNNKDEAIKLGFIEAPTVDPSNQPKPAESQTS